MKPSMMELMLQVISLFEPYDKLFLGAGEMNTDYIKRGTQNGG